MGRKVAEKIASLPTVKVAQEQARTQVKRSNTLIKAMVYGEQTKPPSAKDGVLQSLPESEFLNIAGEILEPPYDPYALIYMAETNGTLTSAVDAYEANIDSFGHRLVPRIDLDSETVSPETKVAAKAEKRKILNFLAMVASRGGLTKLRRKTRADREYTGYAFWEVIRNRRSEVIEFNHIPSPQVRLCPEGEDVVEVKDLYLQLDENDAPQVADKPIYRRFRRFVQAAYLASSGTVSTTCGTRIVWFKEYGDPRILDNENGKFYDSNSPEVTQAFEGSGKPMPESRRASEILFFSRYWPRTPYGVPRWIGDILAVVGKRAAAEVNFVTLKNNNIPSVAILVSNGRMTKATVERIRTFFDTHVRGNANYAQALVLEGEGEYEGDESNHVKIDIKPLANMQHTDALFVEYTKQTNADLLRTFRLPPLFVGDAEAYNRACYSEDTETLTENGWKKWYEIAEEEKIATFNPQTNGVEFHKPVSRHVYPYRGPMIRFANRSTDVLVTPDHDMWVADYGCRETWRKEKAADLVQSRFLFRAGADANTRKGEDLQSFTPPYMERGGGTSPPLGSVSGDRWLEFLGYNLTDGGIQRPESWGWSVVLRQKKEPQLSRMRACLVEMGWPFKEYEVADNTKLFLVRDRGLYEWLAANTGAEKGSRGRHLPQEYLTSLPDRQLRILYEAMMAGDGSYNHQTAGSTAGYLASTSSVLVGQVQQLLVQIGYRTSLSCGEDGCFKLSHCPKPIHQVRSCDVDEMPYDGIVYCFAVPNHLFVTRRNGKVAIQGNTSEVSRRSADEQVFAPERDEFDGQMNEILLKELRVRYWRFLSKTPNVTDNRDIVGILSAAERTGGSTPRIARGILNDVLQGVEEVPPLDKTKFDPDVPFSLTMAQLIGHTGSATEVNQTVAPVMPSGEVPGAQGPSGSLAKEFNLTLLKDILSLGDKANAELEGYLRGT